MGEEGGGAVGDSAGSDLWVSDMYLRVSSYVQNADVVRVTSILFVLCTIIVFVKVFSFMLIYT